MNIIMAAYDSSMSPSNSHYYPSDSNGHDVDNHSLSIPLLALNDIWILPIFVLCLVGILCTIIVSILLIYMSSRRLNGHFLITNLFICFSVAFIYLIIIVFLIRANELFCGLREFLSQFSYALLYSALLCRYIMQWLGSRILSKRTKRLTSLLIYVLLVFIQIPIGILWWYFTIPRICQQRRTNTLLSTSKIPKFTFHFRKSISSSSSLKPCSNRCIVDYRFYATFTYTTLELILCTLIAACLFVCRHCHRNKPDKDRIVSINGYNPVLTFLNMFAFILINLIWITWTLIYYFTHPFFIFPSLIIGMFIIATICLLLIVLPQIYYYSKIKMNDIHTYKAKTSIPSTTLYSNKLASTYDMNDQELLLEEKSNRQKKKHSGVRHGSDLSDELSASGTFLPITRTPKGPYKVTSTDATKTTPVEKLDKLIYGEHHHRKATPNNHNELMINERKVNASVTDDTDQQEQRLPSSIAPLQRQLTSSSIASDFVTPGLSTGYLHRSESYRNPNSDIRTSSSMYCTGYPPPRHDETIIPILCTSERPRTSTPVQMRLLVNSPSSSVPTTRRIYSGSDLRSIRHPNHHAYPPAPLLPTNPSYYSPQPQPQQYLFVDPYRTMPARAANNTWHSVLLQPRSVSHRYPYSYRRFHMDQRSLSQRLWDIDSGDDEDEVEEDIIKVAGSTTPTKESSTTFHSNPYGNTDNILLHIDDDDVDDEDDTYRKQYAHV